MAMSEICVLSSMSKPKLPSCGWLMLPTTFCGSVQRVELRVPHAGAADRRRCGCPPGCTGPGSAGRRCRIFCSCRHWPGRDPDAADDAVLVVGHRPLDGGGVVEPVVRRRRRTAVIEVQPAGWLSGRRHLLQVDQVDDVERRVVAGVALQLEPRARRVATAPAARATRRTAGGRRPDGVFDSASVSSVVPYSQLCRDDSVSFCDEGAVDVQADRRRPGRRRRPSPGWSCAPRSSWPALVEVNSTNWPVLLSRTDWRPEDSVAKLVCPKVRSGSAVSSVPW